MFSTLSAALALAIVTQDQSALRASASYHAPQHAQLWAGDSLEIRGEKRDYLQVYDHRRERAGYIKASQVRKLSLEAGDAAESLAVVRFTRDTPGSESLGIAYAAAYLKAAPALNNPGWVEALDALGSMAESLARRASSRQSKATEEQIAAQIEVVAQYGVQMRSFERNGRMQLCYDGDAYRRLLSLPGINPQQQSRAVLGLSRSDCINPAMPVLQKIAFDQERAEMLEKIDASALPALLKNRLHLRRADVWASVAFQRSRSGQDAQLAAQTALDALASVNKEELADQDQTAYAESAMHAASVRWAAFGKLAALTGKPGLQISTSAGEPGQTCINLFDQASSAEKPLLKRCTYGVVWPASASPSPAGNALALAVASLDGWQELWLFHQTSTGWQVDVLPPASTAPDLAYIEFAGWVPRSNKLLVAREAKIEGRYQRRFEVVSMESLQTEVWADRATAINAFARWQSPMWKRTSLILR